MNLPYVYEVLATSATQSRSITKFRGIHADFEIRLMVQAGLVEAIFGTDQEGAFALVSRRTSAGETFLRAFTGHPIPSAEAVETLRVASLEGPKTKWKEPFDLHSVSGPRAPATTDPVLA